MNENVEKLVRESTINVIGVPEGDDLTENWSEKIQSFKDSYGELKEFLSSTRELRQKCERLLSSRHHRNEFNKLGTYILANIVPAGKDIALLEKDSDSNRDVEIQYATSNSLELKSKGFVSTHYWNSRGDALSLFGFVERYHLMNEKGPHKGKYTTEVLLDVAIQELKLRKKKSRTAERSIDVLERLKKFLLKNGTDLRLALQKDGEVKEKLGNVNLVMSPTGTSVHVGQIGWSRNHLNGPDNFDINMALEVLSIRPELPSFFERAQVKADEFSSQITRIISEFESEFAKEVVTGKVKSFK